MKHLLYKPSPTLGGFTIFDDIFNEIFENDRYYPEQTKHNITNNDDSIELKLDIPGFKKSEIEIGYENNQLTITASKNSESDNRSNLSKAFKIPNINIKKSNAHLEDGVLTLTLEKSSTSKRQQLTIE